MSSILSNSSLSLAAEVTDKIKTIKDKNYQISMRCRRFSKWQHIDTIGSCIDLFWLFHRFAINLYISRTSDKMNMLIKREKWRGEDKISQRDRRNKENERNTKEQETGSSIIAGLMAQFTTTDRTKTGTNFILCCIHRAILWLHQCAGRFYQQWLTSSTDGLAMKGGQELSSWWRLSIPFPFPV